VKQLTPIQINSLLEESVPKHLTENLWLHQKACLLLMQHHPRFMFTIDMGGGKSLLMLTMLRHRKLKGKKVRTIVMVPYITAVSTWIDEIAKFAPELKCCPLLELQASTCDLFIVCYQTAVAMAYKKVKTKKNKIKWALDDELVQAAFAGFDTLICDEIHRVSNQNSLTFELCNWISNNAKYVYGLTGTPFGENLQDLWAEFYIIDFGETLGPNISFFRTIFFTRKAGFFGGMDFKFKKKLMKPLQRMIKNKSIHYALSEFSNLEKPLRIQQRIQLPESIKDRVEQAKKQLYAAKENDDLVEAGNAFMKLRQLSSGFITFKDEDERVKVKFDTNPKLDALCELIEGMPSEGKMVVFHDYVYTNQLISERLKELKIDHARIWGGQKDQIGQLKKFREDERCKILVINSRSGSSALNLQFASYIAFYEVPSIKDRKQAEARCFRPGQKNRVVIYDLFVRGTIDESHYNSVKAGGDFLAEFMAGKVKEV
jgi:SNF2 family DNA or RNA helicase